MTETVSLDFGFRTSVISGGQLLVNGKPILPIERMKEVVSQQGIRLGIITVPATEAQSVCDQMVACGIKGILNFAPVHLDVPEDVEIQEDNIAVSLALLSKKIK